MKLPPRGWPALLAVSGLVVMAGCGSSAHPRSNPNHLSSSETERIIDDQVTIGRDCRRPALHTAVARAVSDLLALYRRGPQRSYDVGPGAPRPTVHLILEIERRQLAHCGRRAEAGRLARALHGT
jgi:hypothetical protein